MDHLLSTKEFVGSRTDDTFPHAGFPLLAEGSGSGE